MTINKKNTLKLLLLFSTFVLSTAYFIEYVLGHQPCNLCMIERIPYLVSIILIISIFIIKKYGEEKFGRRIAHKILETREETPITRTAQLAKLIDEAVPVKDKHKHPATRTFQAIRIYINSELEEIETALNASLDVLKPGGRLVVISFHSLEDRIVKQFIKRQSKGKAVPRGLPLTDEQLKQDLTLKAIGKAIKPSEAELEANYRARSSVLRVAQRLE